MGRLMSNGRDIADEHKHPATINSLKYYAHVSHYIYQMQAFAY
jgi:hypothetical protein